MSKLKKGAFRVRKNILGAFAALKEAAKPVESEVPVESAEPVAAEEPEEPKAAEKAEEPEL